MHLHREFVFSCFVFGNFGAASPPDVQFLKGCQRATSHLTPDRLWRVLMTYRNNCIRNTDACCYNSTSTPEILSRISVGSERRALPCLFGRCFSRCELHVVDLGKKYYYIHVILALHNTCLLYFLWGLLFYVFH